MREWTIVRSRIFFELRQLFGFCQEASFVANPGLDAVGDVFHVNLVVDGSGYYFPSIDQIKLTA